MVTDLTQNERVILHPTAGTEVLLLSSAAGQAMYMTIFSNAAESPIHSPREDLYQKVGQRTGIS